MEAKLKLKSARLYNYKRFTDLTIQGLPNTARLIVLAGPNGCGKSSFIDALWSWHQRTTRGQSFDDDYHTKSMSSRAAEWYQPQVEVEFHDGPGASNGLYVRTAFRNDPDFRTDHIHAVPDPVDHQRVTRMIDNDESVGINYQRLVGRVFAIFDSPPTRTDEFTDSIIVPIRDPILNIFPDLSLNGLVDPLKDGTFRFAKGSSDNFQFKNLSGGEKAVFGLILDLEIAKEYYGDAIYCIDEPEAHTNARVQSQLLKELYGLIPLHGQLVIATHSIGMMRRARELEEDNPGSVVFLDFSDRDFDEVQVIEPTTPDRNFWQRMYRVALDDLAALVTPEQVVICEGTAKSRKTRTNHAHDARCYQTIFSKEFPNTDFVPGGNDTDVETDRQGIDNALKLLVSGVNVIRLTDRDARSEGEIADLRNQGVRVLTRRNLEYYLFHDEVLTALAKSVGQLYKVGELLDAKQSALGQSDGAPDDVKPAIGRIYVSCKDILRLTAPGNTAQSFMRDTLAPLVQEGMAVYEELKNDIFG